MTVINLTALETLLDAPGPIARGEFTLDYWAGRSAVTRVDGSDVVFPKTIRVSIVDGEPTEVIDVPATVENVCARVSIRTFKGGRPLTRYVLIPDVGPVDFGDLEQVDPVLFTPDPSPSLSESVALLVAELTYDKF